MPGLLMLAALTMGVAHSPTTRAESLAVRWLCGTSTNNTASCMSLAYTPELRDMAHRVAEQQHLEGSAGGALLDCGGGTWGAVPGRGTSTGASQDPLAGRPSVEQVLGACVAALGGSLPARGTPGFLDVTQHAKTPSGRGTCTRGGTNPQLGAESAGTRAVEPFRFAAGGEVARAVGHIVDYPKTYKTVDQAVQGLRRQANELDRSAEMLEAEATSLDQQAASHSGRTAKTMREQAMDRRGEARQQRAGASQIRGIADWVLELDATEAGKAPAPKTDGGTRPAPGGGDITCEQLAREFQQFTEDCDRINWQSYSCTAFLAKASGCVDPALVNPGPDGDFTCSGYRMYESEAALKQALILACEAKARTAPGEATGCRRAIETGAPTAALLTSTCWNPKAGGIDENCPLAGAQVAVSSRVPWGDRRAQLEAMRRKLGMPPMPVVASGPTVGPRPGGVKMTAPTAITRGATVGGTPVTSAPPAPVAKPVERPVEKPPIPPR